jgi:hypothetical protein
MAGTLTPRNNPKVESLYSAMEEGIFTRDQVTASNALYQLIRAERPLTEMLQETVRIHAPYTQGDGDPIEAALDDLEEIPSSLGNQSAQPDDVAIAES